MLLKEINILRKIIMDIFYRKKIFDSLSRYPKWENMEESFKISQEVAGDN